VWFGDPLRGLTPGSELKGVLELVAATVGLLAYVFVVGWIVDLANHAAGRHRAGAVGVLARLLRRGIDEARGRGPNEA
jgi:hypothetical protein